MARDHAVYRPRHAEASVLHLVVRQHLEDFLHAAGNRANGAGLPEFIAREFREFLTCGVLAYGFARVRCRSCAFERLVPFSCKGRGFCPSCGGRRMTERAAHLVDEVLPPVPVRQWVLTLPYRLRYLLAWDHGLARAVLAVYARTLLGGGLNLNVHFHTLAFDDDPAVIDRILAHLGLPGARDGPEPAFSVSPLRDAQLTRPFGLP